MQKFIRIALSCSLSFALTSVAAAASRPKDCAVAFANLISTAPISIDEANRLTLTAWEATSRYLRKYGIEDSEANRSQVLAVFDRALSHATTPMGEARHFRNESGLRVVDAPHLESLRILGVPDYVIEHVTIDHHSSFGIGLPANVNSTTQILYLLDPRNPYAPDPDVFRRAFNNFASDNVGDAFGLARSVVRHADEIRSNPALRERFREIAIAEDFGIFGPTFEMNSSDTVPALLRVNDRMLEAIGADRTFMDRVNLGFGEKTSQAIRASEADYDRVLFPRTQSDRVFANRLARDFRKNVEAGIASAEKLRVPLAAKSGRAAPIFFADVTTLGSDSGPFFQSKLIIPQLIRKMEKNGATQIDRTFTIQGSATAATRTVICANVPTRGVSMMTPVVGKTRSFVQAFIAAEHKAIEARLPSLRQMGGEALKLAETRKAQIEQGVWRPQNLPNGNLIFGSTYMNTAEFRELVEQNLELLGYP